MNILSKISYNAKKSELSLGSLVKIVKNEKVLKNLKILHELENKLIYPDKLVLII